MKTITVTSISRNPHVEIRIKGGVVIHLTKCWFNYVHCYNMMTNTFSILYEGLFINVPCRKPKNGFHKTPVQIAKEQARAIKIADEVKKILIS